MSSPAADRTDPEPDPPLRRYDDYDTGTRSGGPSGLTIGMIIVGVLLIGACVIVPIVVGVALPAYQKVRETATRTRDMNNMKQVALAFHQDADVTGRGFYAPYVHDPEGAVKTGLSHRVHLLPYLEQDAVYRRFQLDQPWDGPANKPASDTIVPPYTTPFEPQPTANTPFRSFVGRGAMFNEDGSPTPLSDVTDGLSNTILFVHAADQVPWAEPSEFKFIPGMPLPQFGHRFRANEGGNVAMADGSVRFVPGTVSRKTLIAAITRSGGDQFGPDW